MISSEDRHKLTINILKKMQSFLKAKHKILFHLEASVGLTVFIDSLRK